MDLIVSGMALSLQWTPTLQHAEYCLTGRYQTLPSLVEHPGEVIQNALTGISAKHDARLVLIHLGAEADLGHYLPLLEDQFADVKQVQPASSRLVDVLHEAATLTLDRKQHVVISETVGGGTAAIVLSPPDSGAAGLARVYDLPGNPLEGQVFDYLGTPSPPSPTALQELAAILSEPNGDHLVALGSFNAPLPGQEPLPAFIQAVLAITNQIIPAWYAEQPTPSHKYREGNFLFSPTARPWLYSGKQSRRRAIFGDWESPSSGWELIALEEIPFRSDHSRVRIIPGYDPLLFPLRGSSSEELLKELDGLAESLGRKGSLKAISYDAYTKFSKSKAPFACCLLGKDRDSLEKEISHARTGIKKAFETGQTWNSPAGSYFTPHPLGSAGIAFVYPGAFNSYPGMARELFYSFPGLQDKAREIVPDLSHSLAEDFLYLGGPGGRLDQSEDLIMAEFYDHPNQLIESGISLSALHTLLLEKVFALKPDAVLGYSLGEISMLWANRVWQNVSQLSDIWKNSSLFSDQLVGEMKAVREFWNEEKLPDKFWSSYILKANPQQVKDACDQDPRVFLTIHNTPDEVVIAGETDACQHVVEKLACRALPMPFNAALHNPAIAASYEDFLELYSLPAFPQEGIRFYSAAKYRELRLTEDNLGHSLAKMTTNPVDFPRLVNQVYSDGARIFIEIGPQKTCSRWIEKILAGKPHAVIPINKKYLSDLQGVLKVISLLVSHGVNLTLDSLYPEIKRPGEDARPSPAAKAAPVSDLPWQGIPSVKQTSSPNPLTLGYFEHLDRISAGLAESHQTYLAQQGRITSNLARVLELQTEFPSRSADASPTRNALFTREQISAFTSGDHSVCFGSLFSGFQDRRIPRLPNGPLQFIDRVIHISGPEGRVATGSKLISEFDLPEENWFGGGPGSLPHVALLEMALQPCGFLSAYQGSILGRESQDLYFRNLDGEGTLLRWPAAPGRTITNQVELLSSSSLNDVVIQKYSFELSWGGQTFFQGSSSFGYFTLPMLKNQAGLDGSKRRITWQEEHPHDGAWQEIHPQGSPEKVNGSPRLPAPRRIWVAPEGGKFAKGYLFLTRKIPVESWFFAAHFYQDPVMPGSLGIETMARALMAAAPSWGIPVNLDWRFAPSQAMVWKYRGQIPPAVREITLELHLKSLQNTGSGWEIRAEGQLWLGSKRIYQVENLCLETYTADT